jgi:hypothetical protein
MRKFGPSIFIITSALSGCAVPTQSIDKVGISTLLAAEKIQIVSEDKAKTMHSLGQVIGHSCQYQAVGESSSTKVGAIDQIKIVAAQKGAVAITEPQCEEGGVSLIKNCWNSWECKATALRE